MRTQIRKFIAIGAIVCAMPLASFAQDNLQPADAGDTVVSQQDQQLDESEAQQVAPPDQAPVSTQTFYDQLSPYGQWVNMPTYGYVWIPSAGVGFVPYSNYGHWVYTEYGWTWVSDYAWGWAPFHYGRWGYDYNYGWYWIPGTEWGPAWVCWRHCDGYYGWAPLGWGMNIEDGYYGDYGIDVAWWIFVDEARICDRYVYRYYQPRRNCEYYYHHSNVVVGTHYDAQRNIRYASGPRAEEVARVTHVPVRQVAVRPTVAPGQRYDNQHLHLYKPEVRPTTTTNPRPAPTRPVEINQVPRRSDYSPQQRTFTQPQQQRSEPAPQQQRSQPAQQQRSQPQPQQQQRSYSPPQQQHSAPVQHSAPAGGGGRGGHR